MILDFRRAADERTTSWQRADPRAALVERTDQATFRVMLQDGSEFHRVRYTKERGAFVGSCDCKGFEYRDEEDAPCAHLCTLRKAQGLEMHESLPDMNGHPIEAVDSATLISSGATETGPDKTPIADGGEIVNPPAAGSDGRVFGRPEERL